MLLANVRVDLRTAYRWARGDEALVNASFPDHEQRAAAADYRFHDPRRVLPRESTLSIDDIERRGVKVTRLSPPQRKEKDR